MLYLLSACLFAVQSSNLFSIGVVDQSPREFGLAPNGYHNYQSDSLYIVGRSNAKDWNYVLPGPDDMWAGSRVHEAEIVFSLAQLPSSGNAELYIDQSDAHYAAPPNLQIILNGRVVGEADAKHGESDDTLDGKQLHGTLGEIALPIPMSDFQKGVNTLTIRNARGSWYIFDAVRLDAPAGVRLGDVQAKMIAEAAPQMQAILKTPKGLRQSVSIKLTNLGSAGFADVSGSGVPSQRVSLRPGRQTIDVEIPVVKKSARNEIVIKANGITTSVAVSVKPVRPWTVFLMPHSHVDIGYTNLQDYVLRLHQRNINDALDVARESQSFGDDSRFRFNIEASWPVDRFVQTASPAQIRELRSGLKAESLHISASYANLLTGIMNPEEMMQSYRYSRILQDKLGVQFATASQSDVPGVTWGSVAALHEAGIKYLMLLPNTSDRIGGVDFWMNRPFWWMSPSGRERVLVWEPDTYSVGTSAGFDGNRDHLIRTNHPATRFIESMIFPKLDRLAGQRYPYDMIAEPWSVIDNAPVDADVPYAAKAWNEKYAVPHVVISTFTHACNVLVRRYGSRIPSVKGDFTPYWEDGSGSSAAETSMNRATANRLLDAETLFAIAAPSRYPSNDFLEAWRNVLLYSEHTWGSWNSVWDPDKPEVKAQWQVKQAFALDASRMANDLLSSAGASPRPSGSGESYLNPLSWTRDCLVPVDGPAFVDQQGKPVSTQESVSMGAVALVKGMPPTSAVTLRGRLNGQRRIVSARRFPLTVRRSRAAIFRSRSIRRGEQFPLGRLRTERS